MDDKDLLKLWAMQNQQTVAGPQLPPAITNAQLGIGGSSNTPVDIQTNFNTGERTAIFADGTSRPYDVWASGILNDPTSDAGLQGFVRSNLRNYDPFQSTPDDRIFSIADGDSGRVQHVVASNANVGSLFNPRGLGSATNTDLNAQSQILNQFQGMDVGNLDRYGWGANQKFTALGPDGYFLPNAAQRQRQDEQTRKFLEATNTSFGQDLMTLAGPFLSMYGGPFSLLGGDTGMGWLNSALNAGSTNFLASGGDIESAAQGALTSGIKGALPSAGEVLNTATNTASQLFSGAPQMDDFSWLDALIGSTQGGFDTGGGDWFNSAINGMSNGDWGGFTGWDSINIPMPNATWSGTTDSGTYTGGTNQPTVQTGGMPANWVQQLGSAIFGGSGSGTGTSALLGGALAGLLGNNGGAATATTAPWAGAQPYLIDALTRASQLAGQTPAMPAAPTFGAVPDYTTDQYLQGAINAATQPMRDNFAEFQMPEIRSSAIANGQLGGSRQGIAEGIALSRLNRDIGQIGAGMSQALYGTNLNNRTQQYQMSVANQQQDFTNNMARTQAGFAMPWQALTNYGNMAVGASGRGQTSSVTTPNNPLLNIAGGAATGAGLYKSIYGGA